MYDIITFDCYGTLIDWEGGFSDAIHNAAQCAGVLSQGEIIKA